MSSRTGQWSRNQVAANARIANPSELSLAAAAHEIAAGRLSAEQLVESLLERIDVRELLVGAWTFLDSERAREAARVLDRGMHRGPLHGIPVAIKDLIDTADMPTTYGSAIYRRHQPRRDAACVSRLREAGAIIMGKTVTTEFAYCRPVATRNPRNLEFAPGGSSSGSAAAVADHMVPAGLGTQTGGSIIGPAAYCGILGYKPARGVIPTEGLKFVAPSIDTIGFLCRSLDDIPLLMAGLARRRNVVPETAAPPEFAICRTPFFDQADASVQALIEDTARRLVTAGATCRDIDLPAAFIELETASQPIINSECLTALAAEAEEHWDAIGAEMRELLEKAKAIPVREIAHAWHVVNACRITFANLFAPGEVILTPSVPCEPTPDLADLGDGIFSRTWMMLDAPCLHLLTTGPNDMPLGLQLVAPDRDEDTLLATARWLAQALDLPLLG